MDRQDIDHRAMKLVIGLIALSMAVLTRVFSPAPLTSISASYYVGGWAQSIFVGFLFAIGAFLLAYNGATRVETVLAKVAAAAAAGVALYPCGCGSPLVLARGAYRPRLPSVHFASAAVMFLVLAYFAYGFYRRAREKGHVEANVRAGIYALCVLVILGAIVVLAVHAVVGGGGTGPDYVTYWGETAALWAFAVSWLVASRSIPKLTRPDERFYVFK